ncbi:unnamed protein product [Schistocephalus solidus]|uniref:Endo/exonuclease/phosphatase domain-containing protein n=1 Tax=Schistocephalus solidus TaxID=70667 RepID=A0A183TGD5_SCHSO|nr:unnamed protein product [Schistocephalus solidus]
MQQFGKIGYAVFNLDKATTGRGYAPAFQGLYRSLYRQGTSGDIDAGLFSDNPKSNRPEWRTALVARELARYKVDIAALTETRFSEQGQLEDFGKIGYAVFNLDKATTGRGSAPAFQGLYRSLYRQGTSGDIDAGLFSDNPKSNRPEWRTALVARELARYKVDIAALTETRFSEQGQLEDVGAG